MNLRPSFGFDWWRLELFAPDGRFIARFRDQGEADAYLEKLSRSPKTVPGTVLLRLRGGKWKRKEIEEEDVVDAELNLEIPF
jgi:hypothetical protein